MGLSSFENLQGSVGRLHPLKVTVVQLPSNDAMSERYKAKLENRSYHPDASREGKTLAQFAEDRKRPKSERKWNGYVEE